MGTAIGFAQSIEGFFVGKKADYFQNSTVTPVSQAIIGDPGGPYHFAADISGTSLSLFSPAPRIKTPLNTVYNLSGDNADMGFAANFSTLEALDAAFPNGLYAFQGIPAPSSLSLGSINSYPSDIPRITNTTWNGSGNLVINPLVESTLNFSTFSDYTNGTGGMVDISIYGLTGNSVGGLVLSDDSTYINGFSSEPVLTNYKIPAGFLQGNRTYYVELSFIRIVSLDTSAAPQKVGFAAFVNTTAFVITTEPADQLPFFRRNPGDQTATLGAQIDIITIFDGYPFPTCQWYKDGVLISGATSSTLRINNAQFSDTGRYKAVLTNRAGSVSSNEVTVTVNAVQLPSFTTLLTDVSVVAGGRAFFLTNTNGPTPITYQWFFNGQPIVGANLFQLEILNVQQANVGDYYLVATNAGGSVSTNTVKLTLNSALGVLAADGGGAISYYITADGSLWGTGSDGSTFLTSYPTKIAGGVSKIAPGSAHCLLIKTDGTLWAMGNNGDGQLGDGTKVYRRNPVQIATGVVEASCGAAHSLFIKNDGSLWAMGRNDDAQLGIDDISDFPTPVLLDQGVVAVSAGSSHSLYLKYDGTMWGVGDNYYGQLGDGTQVTRQKPVQVATSVKVILAGTGYSMFLKLDGSLWAVGQNGAGQFGDGTAIYRTQPTMVATGVRSIAGGGGHNMMIKENDSLWGMGGNIRGQLGDGTKVDRPNPIQIATTVASAATGGSHSLYVQKDGTLWGMGDDYFGQLGDGGHWDPLLAPIKIAYGSIPTASAPADFSISAENPGALRLNWAMAPAATSYEVWRSTTNDPATAIRIGQNVSLALFFDNTAQSGVTYFYWIKGQNSGGTSSFSIGKQAAIAVPPSNAVITVTIE